MSHAILYAANANNFFNLGLGVLTDAKPPKVTQVGNSEFILEMDYPVDGKLFNQLKNGNLIKADAGPELKAQRFEIKRLQKSMRKNHVTVYAEHISYQTLDISMPPKVTLTGTAQNAMRQAQSLGLGAFKPFTMTSDITTSNSTTFTIRDIENLRQALSGVEGSILDTWGGEFLFDNYHISLLKQRGRQANAMIAYGRNLIDLEQEESILNTFTSVFPYAVWRTEDGGEEFISGNVVHSEHVDKYPHEKVLPVEFTLDFDEEKPTAAELDALAQTYIEKNDIGVPSVSIQLSHIDLSQSLEFPEYAEAEIINLFDRVKIHFEKLGIDTIAKVVRTVWNVNLERYDEIEVGHVRASMADRFNAISKEAKAAKREAEDARTVSAIAANGINMNFFGPDEPVATKVGDTWFQEDGQYTISKVWDGVIWRVVSDPRLSDQNAQLIGEQQATLEEVKTTADYSYDQLQQTIANSGFTDLDTAFANVQNLSEQAESNAYEAMQLAIGSDGRLTLAEQFIDGFRNTAFDPSTGQLSLTEQTIAGLQDIVSDPVNGLETRVTTIANGFQVLSNDVDELASQLAVTNENVLARVQKGDVISQINLEAESTLIQTGKLLLDTGTVVFGGDAFIPGAYIEDASIDSAKISQIDASQVDVINLNADSISGNEASFIAAMFSGDVSQLTISSDSVGMMRLSDSSGYAFEITNNEARFDLPMNMYAPLSMRTRPLYFGNDRNDQYIQSEGNTLQFRSGLSDNNVQMSIAPGTVNVYATTQMHGNLAMNLNQIFYSSVAAIRSQGNTLQFRINATTLMSVGDNEMSMWRTLNMNGHTIINSPSISDERLKEFDWDAEEDSLAIVKSWRLGRYRFNEKAKDALGLMGQNEFGLSSQNTPDLMTYTAETDIYGVNHLKWTARNSHAIQQLALGHENVVLLASKADLKAGSNEERIEVLEAELKLLKGERE